MGFHKKSIWCSTSIQIKNIHIETENYQSDDLSSGIDQVLPTWQWINELLIGKHLNSGNKKARIILMARPETIAYYKIPNPYYHVSKINQFKFRMKILYLLMNNITSTLVPTEAIYWLKGMVVPNLTYSG
jgi:hypothetical protein